MEEDRRLPDSISVYPATAFAEKDGALVNDRGRVQRLRPAVALPRAVRSELEVIQQALQALGEERQVLSAGGVFREVAGDGLLELAGRTHRDLGTLGIDLDGAPLCPGGGAPSGPGGGAASSPGGGVPLGTEGGR